MRREIYPDNLFLLVQFFQFWPLYTGRRCRFYQFKATRFAEQGIGTRLYYLPGVVAVTTKVFYKAHPFVVGREILFPGNLRKAVQSSGHRHRLNVFPVQGVEVDPLHKVVYILEKPVCATIINKLQHGRFAHPLYGAQTEPYISILVYGKLDMALVDIGSQHLYPHPAGLLHEHSYLLDIADVSRQYRRHVFGGVVGLEITGLISDVGVTGGV